MSLISQSDLEARLGRALTAEEVTSFNIINAATQRTVEEIIGSSVEQQNASIATMTVAYSIYLSTHALQLPLLTK